jgi:hypothetical protein
MIINNCKSIIYIFIDQFALIGEVGYNLFTSPKINLFICLQFVI